MSQLPLSEFADKMNEVMPVIMKEFTRRQMKEFYKVKITLPQLLVLEFLHREGESKMTILAHFMNVTTAAMTGIVDRLVRDGYVVRANASDDRRIINVSLTGRGNALVRRINAQRQQMVIKIFGKISATDRQDYLRILTQIKDILAKENSTIK